MNISLKQLIKKVSDELIESRSERIAELREPIFEIDSLTIEASFTVSNSKNASGGFDLHILSGNLDKLSSSEKIHKITLKLNPITSNDLKGKLKELGTEVPLRPRIARKEQYSNE